MPTTSITFLPQDRRIDVSGRETILQVAMRGDVSLRHKCGGKASCTTCKIRVQSGNFSPVSQKERQRLGEPSIQAGFRLSCQTRPLADCVVEIPEDPLQRAIRLQLQRQREEEW